MTDWSFPPAVVLRGGELVLDPSAEAWGHASALALDDPDFYRWGYMRKPLAHERRERWLHDRRFRDRLGNARYYSIQWEAGSEPIGVIDIYVTNPQERWAEIGYWTHPDHRGRGVATRALHLVTAWAMESAGVAQIDLPIHPENAASKAVARKAGYFLRGPCQVNPPVGGSNMVDLFTRWSVPQ
jgi:RimJ/RimL family protein N-acetyltransferase